MKVFISADIEGVTGVVHDDQTTNRSPNEYMQARKWMTGDVNSAIEGALEAGAKEIYVKDAHADGRNILLDELKKEAFLISGWDVMYNMVQGIDETFNALILIGYHSMAFTENGILAHTMTGCLKQLFINGHPFGEAEISALTAGYYGVPVTFISGDQKVVDELRNFVSNIHYVITKYGMGKETGKIIHPDITSDAIRKGVAESLSDLSKFQPFSTDLPIKMSLKFTSPKMAELISLMPNVQRVSIDEIAYEVEDPINMLKVFRVMLGLAWSQR